jgi:AcrR family transcriptional regulator
MIIQTCLSHHLYDTDLSIYCQVVWLAIMVKAKNGAKRSARDVILETAADLFFREGFRAVGVDTIIERSGVAKMTLYRYFPSKDDLIVAYLEYSNEKFWEWFEESLGEGNAREKLERLFEAVGVLANNPACYGCTFQSTAAEFPDRAHPGHQVAIRHKQEVVARLKSLAENADAHDPDQLAQQLLLVMDGAWVAARVFGPGNPAVHVGTAARAIIAAHFEE